MGAGFENVKTVPQGGGVPDGVGVGVGIAPAAVALKSLNCGPVVLVAMPAHIPGRPAAVKTVSVTAILWMPFQRSEMDEPFMTSSIKPVLPRVSKSVPVRL